MLDLKRLCEDRGIEYIESGHHHCHEGWAQLHCPFCSDGRSGFHLGFNLSYGNFNCWRCGKLSIWEVLAALLRTSDKVELAKTIKKYQTTSPHRKKTDIIRKRSIKLPPGTEGLGKPHRLYLERRGFDPADLVRHWNIQGTHFLSGEWNWRIIVPVYDQEGNMVAYQGRSIDDEVKPKYKMCHKEDCLINPRELIYGIEKAKDSIVIVEGITDVWRIGFGAVALFGIDWTEEQANILRKFPRRFVFFDPEPQAQKRAEKLAYWLSFYPGETNVIEDFQADPADLPPEDIKSIRKLLEK